MRMNSLLRGYEQRVGDLQREVDGYRVCEDAIKAVFVSNFEQAQKDTRTSNLLHAKENELREKENAVQARETALRKHEEASKSTGIKIDRESGEQPPPDENYDNYPGRESTPFPLPLQNGSEPQFITRPTHKLSAWFAIQKLSLLRRHDYYKGWLDCMKAFDDDATLKEAGASAELLKALRSVNNALSPRAAGARAGMLFGWSVLCAAHGVPERDDRFDDRVWVKEDLVRKTVVFDMGFWKAVEIGREVIERIFFGEIEERGLGCMRKYVLRWIYQTLRQGGGGDSKL